MPNIYINANSFVQEFSESTPSGCAQSINSCLPVYGVQDVSFQFIHKHGLAVSTYSLQLVKDGVEVGDRVTGLSKVQVSRPDIDPIFEVSVVFVTSINLTDFENVIDIGECFKIRLYGTSIYGEYALFDTNCFIRIEEECYSSVISYRCNENSFGFYYYISDGEGGNELEGIFNKVRLPFYLTAPQFPVTRKVFVKSNGERKKLSSRIATEYEVNTDYMPKEWHEKLVVAFEHDEVLIQNIDSGVDGGFSQEGNYDIDWQRFLNYPTAPAKCKLFKTPYYNVNSNC